MNEDDKHNIKPLKTIDVNLNTKDELPNSPEQPEFQSYKYDNKINNQSLVNVSRSYKEDDETKTSTIPIVKNGSNTEITDLNQTAHSKLSDPSIDDLINEESEDDMDDFLNEHRNKMSEFQKSMEDISKNKMNMINQISKSIELKKGDL